MEHSENVIIRRVRTPHCFDQAAVIDHFVRPWSPDRSVPRTEFRGIHDGSTFSFRFDVWDDDLVLAEADNVKDRVLGSDRAELFLAEDLNLERYYCLEIDPRGNVLDYVAEFYRKTDFDWRMAGLEVKAEITETGYTVEGHIPFETLLDLRLVGTDNTITAGLFRAEFSHLPDGAIEQDWMPWIDPVTEQPDFHVPAAFGKLVLLD